MIIGLGIIATYTGYVLGQFKMRYVGPPRASGAVLCCADRGMIATRAHVCRSRRNHHGRIRTGALRGSTGHLPRLPSLPSAFPSCTVADALAVFIMGSHILTFSIMLNVTTGHGACTIVFTIVGLLVSLVCTIPRTMRMVSYFSIVSFVSILGAVFITMIGVGVEGRTPPLEVSARPGTPFWLAFGAVGNIIFAYGGFPPRRREEGSDG